MPAVGTNEKIVRRPSWRHPLQRIRWRRRWGHAPAYVELTITIDGRPMLRELADLQAKLARLAA